MATEYVRIEGLEGVMKTLTSLPPEIVSKRGGPVRTALRNASKLLVEDARANVLRIVQTPNKGGEPTRSTGLLWGEAIRTYRSSRMEQKGERYTVRISRKKYPPHRGDVTAPRVGALLEQGTEDREPMPWLRPAFDANKHKVIAEFTHQLRSRLDGIVKKLARQNRVA